MPPRLPLAFTRAANSVLEAVAPERTALGATGYAAVARQAFASVEQADGTPAWKAVGTPLFSAREFGAYGDGVHDDTAALRAALLAARSHTNPATGAKYKFGLYLPAGVYLFDLTDGPLAIDGLGFFLCGDGPEQTVVVAYAGAAECVLRVTGMDHHVRDLTLTTAGAARPTRILFVDQRPGPTSGNSYQDVTCSGTFVEGVRVGAPGDTGQCDQQAFYRCKVRGGIYLPASPDAPVGELWQAGWVFGGGVSANNLAHYASALYSVWNQHGVRIENTQVVIDGGLVQSNRVDFQGAGQGWASVRGIRSEASPMFFRQQNVGGYQAGLTMHIADCSAQGPLFENEPVRLGTLGATPALGTHTLVDAAGDMAPGALVGAIMIYRSGAQAGPPDDWFGYPWNRVTANDAATLTVAAAVFAPAPAAGDAYVLILPATGGDYVSLTDDRKAWAVDQFKDWYVWFLSQGNQGTCRRVVGNDAHRLVFDAPVPFPVDASTAYVVTNAPVDLAWLKCQTPGKYSLERFELYGTSMRWSLGVPPRAILHGDKRPAVWTVDGLAVRGAARAEALVTNDRALVRFGTSFEIDAAGDVAGPDFGGPDPASSGALTLLGDTGLRVARAANAAFGVAVGAPPAAGLDGGATPDELVLVGDVRADGAERVAGVDVGGDYPCTGHERLLRLRAPGATVTLPSAAVAGAGVSAVLAARDFTGALAGAPVVFAAPAGQAVNGGASVSLAVDWGGLVFVSDGGTQWSAR